MFYISIFFPVRYDMSFLRQAEIYYHLFTARGTLVPHTPIFPFWGKHNENHMESHIYTLESIPQVKNTDGYAGQLMQQSYVPLERGRETYFPKIKKMKNKKIPLRIKKGKI